jgi:hypothetical protein
MSEFTELNKFFEFELVEVELSASNTFEDLECTSPVTVLPTYQEGKCTLVKTSIVEPHTAPEFRPEGQASSYPTAGDER